MANNFPNSGPYGQPVTYDNLDTFVEETHLDLVMRMMHFYDVFLLDSKKKEASKNIGDVLRFIGWDNMTDKKVREFLLSINVEPKAVNLKKEEVRTIFKKWIEKVASDATLLCKCFQFFDIDNDGSISRDEIIKIFYRTTEEMRIKLIDDVISKLDEGIYYYEELGLKPKTLQKEKQKLILKATEEDVVKDEDLAESWGMKLVNKVYKFLTEFVYSFFLEFLLAWALILFAFIPFI